MFVEHNPFLVALSVVIAILGGYTGLGLAARVRGTGSAGRRLLLAGAAFFLAVGVWTMHFVAMLAAPLPLDTTYLVLPTIVSFLICALVMGVSLFFVSLGEPSNSRVLASALLLGVGIVSMHYVGIHGLAGSFRVEHQHAMMIAAAVIAVGTAYGGLRIFLARHGGMRLALSASAFGIAVSGMHYTAMYGMRFLPGPPLDHAGHGLAASPEVLALIVSLLCFLIIFGFLLFLVPEPRSRALISAPAHEADTDAFETARIWRSDRNGFGSAGAQTQQHLPTRSLGQPFISPATRLPVEGADGTNFVEAGRIRSIKANAHYTLIHDGSRERMCPWAISHAEAQLDPATFLRVHRSHIVSIPHVSLIRKEGDSAVVELDGEAPHLVPVSRARIAELKARLGLIRRGA
jgi:NO-binding membrane sensor protein with MHYT domain